MKLYKHSDAYHICDIQTSDNTCLCYCCTAKTVWEMTTHKLLGCSSAKHSYCTRLAFLVNVRLHNVVGKSGAARVCAALPAVYQHIKQHINTKAISQSDFDSRA